MALVGAVMAVAALMGAVASSALVGDEAVDDAGVADRDRQPRVRSRALSPPHRLPTGSLSAAFLTAPSAVVPVGEAVGGGSRNNNHEVYTPEVGGDRFEHVPEGRGGEGRAMRDDSVVLRCFWSCPGGSRRKKEGVVCLFGLKIRSAGKDEEPEKSPIFNIREQHHRHQ